MESVRDRVSPDFWGCVSFIKKGSNYGPECLPCGRLLALMIIFHVVEISNWTYSKIPSACSPPYI
jgi:hypothetical protein